MTFIRQDNEKVIVGPEKMVTVPPRNYCIVENPVLRDGGTIIFLTCLFCCFYFDVLFKSK